MNRNSHRYRKQMYGYQGTVGEGISCDTGIDTYTLLYTKQTTNKDLPYTTGNSTQYSVMTYMGKEPKWTYTKKAYTHTHTHTQELMLLNCGF